MKNYILFHSILVFVQKFDEDEPQITVLNCKNNVVKFHSLTPQSLLVVLHPVMRTYTADT